MRLIPNTASARGSDFSAIVSVHDVMPKTLPEVLEMLSLLERLGVPQPTLLVVPGKPWCDRALGTLIELQCAGYKLAGHGWSHEANGPRTLFHKLHSKIVSENAAEHLSRTRGSVRNIISNCYRWFASAGLRAPQLYVPPAWAMGAISRADLRTLSFARYEYLNGIYDASIGEFKRLPLAGFEARSRASARALRAWNAANIAWARARGRPLRISIHPADLKLPLAKDLKQLIANCPRFLSDEQVMVASA